MGWAAAWKAQSTGKNWEFLEHSTPVLDRQQDNEGGRTEKSILCPSTASFFMATTTTQVGTCKKSETELLSLLKNEHSGHGALKQKLAACSPLPSLSRHILLPDGGITQQKKKGWKPTWHNQSPGSGLITCLSPIPLHVHLTLSHITDCRAAKDYGSKNKCRQSIGVSKVSIFLAFQSGNKTWKCLFLARVSKAKLNTFTCYLLMEAFPF